MTQYIFGEHNQYLLWYTKHRIATKTFRNLHIHIRYPSVVFKNHSFTHLQGLKFECRLTKILLLLMMFDLLTLILYKITAKIPDQKTSGTICIIITI